MKPSVEPQQSHISTALLPIRSQMAPFCRKTISLSIDSSHSVALKEAHCYHMQFCEICAELSSQSLSVFHLPGPITLSWETGAKELSAHRTPARLPCPHTPPAPACCTGPLKGLFQYCVEAQFQVNRSRGI